MCMYIGIEDLAANALIRILSLKNANGEVSRFVRFSQLLDYGMAVIKYLNKVGEEAVLIYDRESNSRLFTDYSSFFVRRTDDDGYDGIQLKEGITINDIITRFIGQIPVAVQNALSDAKILGKFFMTAA